MFYILYLRNLPHNRVYVPLIAAHTLLLRADHQYLNGQHLACEVLTRMYVILTRSELLFIYKMVQEIISNQERNQATPIILWSIPWFPRMTSPNLRLKPTADLKCVRSWSKVRTSHGRMCTMSAIDISCKYTHTRARAEGGTEKQ